jgi:phytoene/squalene synthetase
LGICHFIGFWDAYWNEKKMSAVPELVSTTTPHNRPSHNLAAAITWAASKQTYFTVRLLVDRDRRDDAYRAYAYFRWVDDRLDEGGLSAAERVAFVERQGRLVEELYRGGLPETLSQESLSAEERMLVALVENDREPDSGLQSYIRHMMAVMAFDAERRGRLITESELRIYTRWLAVAVTEALHYFIGSRCGAPQTDMRYLAATGAHVIHMLRDTLEDVEAGYINVPREVVEAGGIDPGDVDSPAYRAWVKRRVELARDTFRAGRAYLEAVENPRCRLAGYAYMARFESVLDAIERDDYRLRATYPERKTLWAALEMGRAMADGMVHPRPVVVLLRRVSSAKG